MRFLLSTATDSIPAQSSNGLNAVGSVASFILSVSLAWNSDRTGERGFHIAAAMLINAAGLLGTALPAPTASKWGLYASLMIAEAGMGAGQGISAAWLSSYTDERLRPIALSAYVMSIQLANFVGANIVQAKDAPRYKPALFIAGGCAFGGAAVILVRSIALSLTSPRS